MTPSTGENGGGNAVTNVATNREASATAGAGRSAATGRWSAIRAIARFEGRNRLRVSVVIAVLFSVFGAFYVWVGPQVVAGEVFSDMLDSMPPALNELLGFESLQSLEGLLASEYYTFGWIVGFGGYLAYTAAGAVAGDLSKDRMDTLLAAPISRPSVLLGKYLALLVPLVVVNAVVPLVLYAASVGVGEPIAIGDLAAVHALSAPYLLAWGAIGLFVGVVVRRGRTAGRVALGLVVAGWFFESVIATTDYGWAGGLSPMRYFDAPDVLVNGIYDLLGAGVLLAVAGAFVGLALVWFERADL